MTDLKEGIPRLVGCLGKSLVASGMPHASEFEKEVGTKDYFDEADCLSEGTLISFLRQLRNGYVERVTGKAFPLSIALVGMRNLLDYKARVRPEGETLGSASPFNIVTKALTLENFTCAEVVELYGQHTADTSQVFEGGVVEALHNDYSQAVTCEEVRAAIQRMILSRPTHLDSLMERL